MKITTLTISLTFICIIIEVINGYHLPRSEEMQVQTNDAEPWWDDDDGYLSGDEIISKLPDVMNEDPRSRTERVDYRDVELPEDDDENVGEIVQDDEDLNSFVAPRNFEDDGYWVEPGYDNFDKDGDWDTEDNNDGDNEEAYELDNLAENERRYKRQVAVSENDDDLYFPEGQQSSTGTDCGGSECGEDEESIVDYANVF